MRSFEKLKIAVAGTGYVGLSIAILLAQHHQVIAVDDVKSITTNLRKIDEIKTVTRIEKFEDEPN